MGWQRVFAEWGQPVMHRHELLAFGATGYQLTVAVRSGHLIRIRRDHYSLPATDRHLVEAVRVGGRIGCVTALASYGVFAYATEFTHVQMGREASRMRSPHDRRRRLTTMNRAGVTLHWHLPDSGDDGDEWRVGPTTALAQSLWCQEPEHALASIDNALFLGLIHVHDLPTIFSLGPRRTRDLISLVDSRAESGQETVVRMILKKAGLRFEPQVTFPGIGRVDFLVEGRLVIEADSRLAHDGWEKHLRDRNRDVDLGRLGYPSIRPVYQRIMETPDELQQSIVALLRVIRARS